MATTYHDSTQASVTTTPNVSVTRPALDNGDTVFVLIFTRANVAVATPPAGFSEVPDASGVTSSTASGVRVAVYRKYVATASGEPANYTATMSTNCNGSVICVSVSGADPTDPVQDADFLADSTASDAVVTAPSVGTTTTDALVLSVAAMNTTSGIASWSAAGVTEVEDVASAAATNRVSAALGHRTQAAVGTTGTTDWNATLLDGTSYGPAAGVTITLGGAAVVSSAGSDQTVAPGTIVTVDTSASSGAILSRSLAFVSGAVDISDHIIDATTVTPKFIAPAPPGTTSMALVLRETVVGDGNTDTDDVTITVTPGGGGGGTSGPSLVPKRLGPDGLPVG